MSDMTWNIQSWVRADQPFSNWPWALILIMLEHNINNNYFETIPKVFVFHSYLSTSQATYSQCYQNVGKFFTDWGGMGRVEVPSALKPRFKIFFCPEIYLKHTLIIFFYLFGGSEKSCLVCRSFLWGNRFTDHLLDRVEGKIDCWKMTSCNSDAVAYHFGVQFVDSFIYPCAKQNGGKLVNNHALILL